MEDIAVYCSWADAQLTDDPAFLEKIPTKIRSIILRSTDSQYLKTLSETLRLSKHTDQLFPLYKPLFPELLAGWAVPDSKPDLDEAIATLSCLARVLPFATYLRPHVKTVLSVHQIRLAVKDVAITSSELTDVTLLSLLLSLFRLLSFDRDMLSQTISPLFFSSFLRHPSLPARYLAIQCLCMVMHFADAFCEKVVETYVGQEAIHGLWEGKEIDYRLLKLWEEDRWKRIAEAVAYVEGRWQESTLPSRTREMDPSYLSSRTANIGGVLHLRLGELDSHSPASSFVLTSTSKRNLRQLGRSLLDPKPILISGQAGSGKTCLVHEAARLLNKLSTMITLHLNEQTDAKSLLGLHSSSPDGQSFTWQAGILTKAMQQGSWVLIEDIDRAPAEVMGVLRPILENGELFLANRKERIQPKDGFRILATLKTSGQSPLQSNSRYSWLLNPRLWSSVGAASYAPAEIEVLLRSRYPTADPFIPVILRVHEQLSDLYKRHPRFKNLQTRTPSLRDLLNFSRRVVRRLRSHGAASKPTALPERVKFDMLKDAVDCYAAYLNYDDLQELVAGRIAQEMGISPQQMRHVLDDSFTNVSEASDVVRVGRSTLEKVAGRRRQLVKAPFALTSYSKRTLDCIAASASCSEPCLLVGETGVGKTTLVQHIANLVGQNLTVVNVSQQSEASDLLGGLKPVTTRSLILPLVEKFNTLFEDTFSTKRNEKFRIAITKAAAKQNWSRLMILWSEAMQLAAASLNASPDAGNRNEPVHPSKRRKLETPKYEVLRKRWADFSENLNQIRSHVDRGDKNHTFAFVEGRLVQAVREGEWVLLDEINLAPSDALDSIVSLLHNGDDTEKPSLLLAEAGNVESITAHPNFRIFAAMNPATDTGKKDLSPGLRSRFTEIYVPSGDNNLEDLTKIIQTYLPGQLDNDKRAALDLAKAYMDLKVLNEDHKLTDGAGEIPHFSIRSLVRCLLYVSQYGPNHGLRRAMYEGFAMSFFTVLSRASEKLALPFLEKHVLSNVKNRRSFLTQQPKLPHDGEEYIAFRHHIVKRGPMTPDFQPHYIRTPSVERNLLNLARAASMRRFPILLQGPTSAGKTSMVEYLAKLSGNKFVRINNHEHTDLQEYLGSYVSDADGKLIYREGVLVDALRQGHWIVLDELNLAPSDVLEALNRLLDDNRELLIPESQEVVRPHPNFMLFATQNPAGLYGGRKRLSRAFRNRFLEIHFDDIPEDELEVILRERAQIAPSFCTHIVAVYKKLALQRQSSRLFEQRNSFATLRDLFRWAARPVDDRQQLSHQGFMLLAERVREPAERAVVKKTIEETMKVIIDETALYGLPKIPKSIQNDGSIVWTPAMRRIFVLVVEALKNNEPVLLVGETGCGKTQICQVISEAFGRPLDIYNAHTNTETGDLIGSQRPIRNRSELGRDVQENWRAMLGHDHNGSSVKDFDVDKITEAFPKMELSKYDPEAVQRTRSSIGAYQSMFAWSDGSLVRAMKKGNHFLLDEISLAEDSVLERLNSVLEPSRTILLAEKGSLDNLVIANPSFQFLATMNPGGDYGKRELSAALRNRLTEIWVPPLSQEADIVPIVQIKLKPAHHHLAETMLKFATWFRYNFHNAASKSIALRDLLAWADFINRAEQLEEEVALVQGAFMVFVDSIGANPAGMTSIGATDLNEARRKCLEYLQTLASLDVFKHYEEIPTVTAGEDLLFVGPFSLPRDGHHDIDSPEIVFDAPTTLRNTMRVARALQLTRPILLEGSPGVGKTSIVTALARACGKQFSRVNLSDQTDLMDLFGADAPSENEQPGKFSWQNGPLLEAMQSGGWVLLDEMNLASQSVLEGLNSCLDHRREVYIAELDKSFTCHPDFTLFAAQNPHHQGGGRKGLPASFVNRFTIVYADSFQHEDLMRICVRRFSNIEISALEGVIKTASKMEQVMARVPAFSQGGPWDINLRDVSRWLGLCEVQPTLHPAYHFRTIVAERFRTPAQRNLALGVLDNDSNVSSRESFYHTTMPTTLQVGSAFLSRNSVVQHTEAPNLVLAVSSLPAANSVIAAVNQSWPVILTGPSGSGKTTLVRSLAAASGVKLFELSMNADVDAMDLVGGFEQYDVRRDIMAVQDQVRESVRQAIALSLKAPGNEKTRTQLFEIWQCIETDELTQSDLRAVLPPISTFLPDLRALVEKMATLLDSVRQASFRFSWNDGILVDAIENGSWLVLDNANLCNPSVLDRLNSLLEPGGYLSISEQHNGGGSTRLIKPHPNFRVFLTMDPRYGELSRAMRNRSLEIFMPAVHQTLPGTPPIQYPSSSITSRLRHLSASQSLSPNVLGSVLDNLSITDMAMISDDDFSLPESDGGRVFSTFKSVRQLSDVQEVYRVLPCPQYPAEAHHPQLLTLNEPMILLHWHRDDQLRKSSALLTRGWYMFQRIAVIKSVLRDASATARTVAVRDRTILAKSASVQIEKAKDSIRIPNVAAYAESLVSKLGAVFHTHVDPRVQSIDAVNSILTFTLELFRFCDAKTINMSVFTAYLQMGVDMGRSIEHLFPELSSAFLASLDAISAGSNVLRTGFGLQQMWQIFRPETARTISQLKTQLALEELIRRFDLVCRFLPHPRGSLSVLRSKLQHTYVSIVQSEQPETSLAALQEAVSGLELQSRKGFLFQSKFETVIDYIYQTVKIQGRKIDEPRLEILAMFRRQSERYLLPIGGESSLPTLLCHIASFAPSLLTRESTIGLQFVDQLLQVHQQHLGMLNHAREELHELAKAVTSQPDDFGNIIPPLTESLRAILGGMIYSHYEYLTQEARSCFSAEGALDFSRLMDLPHDRTVLNGRAQDGFRQVYLDYIYPNLIRLQHENHLGFEKLKLCLVNLSLAGLILMVPDKVFDPALGSKLKYDIHARRVSELYHIIEGQKAFHRTVMGQETSLVIRVMQQELLELGPAPSLAPVVRPENEELSQVQEVFARIVNVIGTDSNSQLVRPCRPGSSEWVEQYSSHQGKYNLNIIIERLESLNRAYDDFVKPILWFLKCLLFGLELEASVEIQSNDNRHLNEIIRNTPLLGAGPEVVQAWAAPQKSISHVKVQWLEYLGLRRSLTSMKDNLPTESLFGILDSFYFEWKTHLIRDQTEAATRSRYYAYRGDSAKDEEIETHELNEMFPQFDGEGEAEPSEDRYDARTIAKKLSSLLQHIFSQQNPQDALRKFVLCSLNATTNLKGSTAGDLETSFAELLPAIFLQMEPKIKELDGATPSHGLNIYTVSRISESQKLLDLVHEVQLRFYTIQEKWPDHAVPTEVLSFCTEVLHLSFGDPIAKLLTKTEKLYAIISQWQSIASKEWSVSPLVDQLSTLIISWRRLELLSWSRLLDEEKRRHEEDAQAWYFIAYEAVVYNPRNMHPADQDTKSYRVELVQTLEGFLKMTTLGQYSSRLRLLDTLRKTITDLPISLRHLESISACVLDVIEHYRRYEANVEASLQKGRAELEKALNEQIRLASWKDTNITALRDSARHSHHKLFKIVRKYRDLLNQVVDCSHPSDTNEEALEEKGVVELSRPQYKEEEMADAVESCAQVIKDWSTRPERLTKPLGAVRSMQHLYMAKETELHVALEIASFRRDLCDAIKELRTQTPSTLTEENASFVRHLQERKRRLLADTLRAVAHMGIRRNLPTSELEKQSSTAVVLTSLACPLQKNHSPTMSAANDTFHELLDVMPQVRAARGNHSEDLTEGEINRSVGMLEGLLFIARQQRQAIPNRSIELEGLESQLSLLRSLKSTSSDELAQSANSDDSIDTTRQHLCWLAELLILSCRILSFQAHHANFEVKELLESLKSHARILQELRKSLDEVSAPPPGLRWKSSQVLLDKVSAVLLQLGSLLREWQVKEPRVGLVLKKLVGWTERISLTQNGIQNGLGLVSLQEFDQNLRDVVDQIFVALQRLSSVQMEMQTAVEDQGWLSKSARYPGEAIRSLQVKGITARLECSVVGKLHGLALSELKPARNLLVLALPVIEQYYYICEHLYGLHATNYLETCRLAVQLAKSFTTLASQGFCRPSEAADGQEQSGKLENGTGLGEGEGAEDISKDVEDDEDLSELAQSGQKEDKDGEMENTNEAIDMGNDDLQGEMGDLDEQRSDEAEDEDHSGDEDENEMDEETGSVDDLDPNAVDEKMWDDIKNEAEKDKQMKNDEAKGKKSDDQTAVDGEKAEGDEMEDIEGEEIGEDEKDEGEGEGVELPEGEQMDSHVDDEKALDLPDELQLTGEDEMKEDDISDDGMDELSDLETQAEKEVEGGEADEAEKQEQPLDERGDDDEIGDEDDEIENGVAQDDEIMEDQPHEPDEEKPNDHDTRDDDVAHNLDEAAGGESGAANEIQDAIDQDQNVQGMNQTDKEPKSQESQSGKAPEIDEQGETGKGSVERGSGRTDTLEHQQSEALRRLADVLDQWHQRRDILPASEEQNPGDKSNDVEMADADFEHVQDENEGDAQALGAAAADQAQNLDLSKAIEDDNMPVNKDTDVLDILEPEEQENIAERFNRLQAQPKAGEGREAGALVASHQQQRNEHNSEQQDNNNNFVSDDLSPDIEHLDLSSKSDFIFHPTSTSDAVSLWHQCSTTTHQFSLLLTEQLRLILSPTTATKLRGDFRTGKRLNIKRIIPYIASNYKRDKIWMRRSVPSKRSYQILIAVDDSKSMSESGADVLAFETLALLTKALAMLEVGDICVVGFGDQPQIRVAHPFGTPFSPAESGPSVFQAFSFEQRGTDVRSLVKQSIQLFRDARSKGPTAAEGLWQLQLIVSDAHCSDHEGIARLVRQAHAEKIVIVFVIVDAGEESILDLKEAVFELDTNAAGVGEGSGGGEMRVRTKRYLDDFPFPYYLVVRDVRDLPGVLATALKGWFGSVVDVQE